MSSSLEIIYKKISEDGASNVITISRGEASLSEMDKINELRKMVMEVNEQDPCTYTSS